VASTGDRLFQIFGRDTAALMLATAAEMDFARAGLPSRRPGSASRITRRPTPDFCAFRVRLQAGAAEAEPQLDLRLRQTIAWCATGCAACAD